VSSKSDTPSILERHSKGLELLRQKDVDGARREFESILEVDSEYALAYFGIGCVHALQGSVDRAVKEWERTVEIDPGCGEAHYALAWAYYDEGDQERGYEYVSRAVESGVDLSSVKDVLELLFEVQNTGSYEEIRAPSGLEDIDSLDEIRKVPPLYELVFQNFPSSKEIKIALGIVIAGLAIRLFSLFFVTPIDFRWESYHYWQIAYYTLHVGTKHFRMWDLGGMEYFWGPLPIWIQSILLWIFRTKSMVPFRFFNTLMGCATIYLAYRIGLRYGDSTAAKISAMIAAVNPILIFNNIIGMEETLGVFFILLSLLVICDHRVYGGVFLGLASLCRIEFWPLSFGIIFSIFLFERGKLGSHWFSAMIGWMIAFVPYMIHLQWATGNAIYPFYWNFLGNIAGVWNPWYVSPVIRSVFCLIFIVAVLGFFTLLKYRGRIAEVYILLITALGFWGYHGLVYTLSGSAPLFERFFVLDAALVSCLAGLFYTRNPNKRIMHVIIPILLLASLVISVPYYIGEQKSITDRNAIIDVFLEKYSGGTILSDMPMMTYRLISKGGISHTNIVGSLYADYQNLTTALQWLRIENATYLINADTKAYKMLIFFREHDLDDLFISILKIDGIEAYYIDQSVINLYLD
jgi:hypothetical protein